MNPQAVSNLNTNPERCITCRRRPSVTYLPCEHRVYCELCSTLYLHVNSVNGPAPCPFGTAINHQVTYILDEHSGKYLYYTPALGYCEHAYLIDRIFVSPSGIAWRYFDNRATLPWEQGETISISCREGINPDGVDWANIRHIRRVEDYRPPIDETLLARNLTITSRVRFATERARAEQQRRRSTGSEGSSAY